MIYLYIGKPQKTYMDYTTLHFIALPCITVHAYIPYVHTYVQTFIYSQMHVYKFISAYLHELATLTT